MRSRLARRFVSSFVVETDATFNTNQLNLPLSVLVGVTNIGKTFPAAYCYTNSSRAKANGGPRHFASHIRVAVTYGHRDQATMVLSTSLRMAYVTSGIQDPLDRT